MFRLTVENENDWYEVEALYDLAFAPGREALSSYRLREATAKVAEICLVARDAHGILAGAIRYWPVSVGTRRDAALLLGPVAVHPTYQGEGVGGVLIRDSLDMARDLGWLRVILVGDAPYYQRFGFSRALTLKFPPPTNPDRLLMLALQENGMDAVSGLIGPWEG